MRQTTDKQKIWSKTDKTERRSRQIYNYHLGLHHVSQHSVDNQIGNQDVYRRTPTTSSYNRIEATFIDYPIQQ